MSRRDELVQLLQAEIVRNITGAEWDGKGLPPVGTVCEEGTGFRWRTVTVIAHGESGGWPIAICQGENTVLMGRYGTFRPLTPPRQSALNEALAALPGEVRCKAVVERAISLLIDAGWHR